MELAKCAKCESEYISYFHFFESRFWRRRCPKCGSAARIFTEDLKDVVVLREAWSGSVRNSSFTGKRKIRGWFFFGHEWSTGHGKFIHKSVSVDKNTDEYYEKITDIQSGETLPECQESFRSHQGHGSAKFSRKARES